MSAPEHLLALPDEQIFALFITAVTGLKIDGEGVWSLPAEIEAAMRLCRQVQERTIDDVHNDIRADALHNAASSLRLLLWRTGFVSETLIENDWAAWVHMYFRDRARLLDMLPPTPVGAADIREPIELAERAVLHEGRWHAPRFNEMPAQAVAALPLCDQCSEPVLSPHPGCVTSC